LDGPDSKGGKELARWMDFRSGKIKTKPSQFKAYNDDTVVLVLRRMFFDKCAYCETKIAAGDVEHFRPKSAAVRDDGTRLEDGYWWLAAKWDNLLYSCVNCNQRRKVERVGEEGRLVTLGKGVFFPIADNKVKVKDPGDEVNEEPLLLNPVTDTPCKHMRVNVSNGEERGCLQPVEVESGALDQKGEITIRLLGLNNVVTVELRRQLLEDLSERMRRIEKLSMQINKQEPGSDRDRLINEMKTELVKLCSYLSPDRPYVMLSRQVILPFMKQFTGG